MNHMISGVVPLYRIKSDHSLCGGAPIKIPLSKNLKIFGWVSLLTDISGEMIFPLLPVFLTTVLGSNALALGFIEGVSDTTASLLKFISGRLSDKFKKRKFFVLIGYGLSSFARPVMCMATHWSMVLGVRFIDRVGKGIRTAPRDAMIASEIDKADLGRAFGFQRMMDHTGAVIGSLLAALLIALMPGQYRLIFLLASLPAIASFIVLTRSQETTTPIIPKQKTEATATAPLPRPALIFLALVFLFNIGNATDAFLLLRLKEGGLPAFSLPLIWAGFSIMKGQSNALFGKISDKMNKKHIILMGWIYYGVIYTLFALKLSPLPLTLLFLAYGIFYGLTEGPERALMAHYVESKNLGSAYGSYHTVLGIVLLPASLLFGFVWNKWGYTQAFIMGGSIAIISSLLFGIWVFASSEKKYG